MECFDHDSWIMISHLYLPRMYEFKLYPVLDFLLSPLCITAQWFTCLIDLALTSKPWLDLLSGYTRLSNEPSTATESCIGCLWHSENNFHHWYPVRSILQTCDIFELTVLVSVFAAINLWISTSTHFHSFHSSEFYQELIDVDVTGLTLVRQAFCLDIFKKKVEAKKNRNNIWRCLIFIPKSNTISNSSCNWLGLRSGASLTLR